MKKLIIGHIFLALLFACSKKADESVSIIKHGHETEYLIHLKEVKDSLTISISDVAENFRFIKLETKDECMLNRGVTLVTDEFILIQKPKYGILQFDINGKFIRTLVKQGQGPDEYMSASWTVDEKNQVLYLSDGNRKSYILRYDLRSGLNLGNLEKFIPGNNGDIAFTNDNRLLITCSGKIGSENQPYYMYWQDLNGAFQGGITAPPDYYLRSSRIFILPNGEYRYQIYDVDTIFSISDDQIVPFMFFDYGEENPPSIDYVGHKRMSIYFEAASWVQFYKFYITGIDKYEDGGSSTYGAIANYILDKKSLKVYNSGKLFFNPTHEMMNSSMYQSINFQPNGIVHYAYQAIDLIEQAEKALADPDFKEPYRSMFSEAVKNLTENDNPVLLIGSL